MAALAPSVTKSLFLTAQVCPTRGWFSRTRPTKPTPGDQLRFEEGQAIGTLARQCFPHGRFRGAVTDLTKLFAESDVLFEAACEIDGYVARADILERRPTGVTLIEVKSSLYDEAKVKPEHIDDMAYTAMVLMRAGLRVDAVELMRVARGWRRGMPVDTLFRNSDHTAAVMDRARFFDTFWDSTRQTLFRENVPASRFIFACRDCDYFDSDCLGKGIADPIFFLPRLTEAKFTKLTNEGIHSIHSVPDDFELTDNQSRVHRCIKAQAPQIDNRALQQLLGEIAWPAGYLDFETFAIALPLWDSVAPHETIPTQYSLHVCDGPGKIVEHRHYLADPNRDCRREFAEQLIDAAAELKTIVVYSGYEKRILTELAKLFPDLKESTELMISRLFDLEKAFTQAVCFPAFRGRTSIKVTLPVLVNDMTYEGMPIADGDSAVAAFARLAKGTCKCPDEAEELRRALLDYCRQDTLAMVRIHQALCQLAV